MMNHLQYRTTDISGNAMLDDDGPRWPPLKHGWSRVHCHWCLHTSDAPTLAGAELLSIHHAEAQHGWVQRGN